MNEKDTPWGFPNRRKNLMLLFGTRKSCAASHSPSVAQRKPGGIPVGELRFYFVVQKTISGTTV
jgi:hypothetical protein